MTQPVSHVDDDVLSAFVDDQLEAHEMAQVGAHLEACSDCRERADGLRAVSALLRRLPDVAPPRDFALGPRVLERVLEDVDPPNVVRLRRWYVASRAVAGVLAAVFVMLLAGTVYVDAAKPVAPAATLQAARSEAPAAAPQPVASPTTAAAAANSAPAAAGAGAAAPAAARRAPVNPQADDQVAAATTVGPLPTLAPTPVPTARPVPLRAPLAVAATDPAAPLQIATVVAAVLAVVAAVLAFAARRRLRRASLP